MSVCKEIEKKKKAIAAFLLLVFIVLSFSSCSVNESSDVIDGMLDDLEDDYSRYREEAETDPTADLSDTLQWMLDQFVSGLSTPDPSSIQNTELDPEDDDAQDLISSVNSTVSDEANLEALILQSMKNVDTEITFEVTGNWLTQDLLYEIVFERIHDVYMIDAFGLYSYSATWTPNGADTFYELSFNYINDSSPDDVRTMRHEIESRAKEVVRDLNLGGKSDYEIVEAVDRYLCDNVYYPDEPYVNHDHTPWGTLFTGRAVCEGYARTAKILCDLCGVDCYYVVGYCNNDPINGGHGWNLVKVDGEWYQLDITWNDGSGTKDFFLVTDDYMSLSRAWDRSKYPASASSPYSH